MKYRVWHKKKVAWISDEVTIGCDGTVYWDEDKSYDPDDVVVQLATGAKDINGVDIYEGDVIQNRYSKKSFEVIYSCSADEVGFILKDFIGEWYTEHTWEIVRNIFTFNEQIRLKTS